MDSVGIFRDSYRVVSCNLQLRLHEEGTRSQTKLSDTEVLPPLRKTITGMPCWGDRSFSCLSFHHEEAVPNMFQLRLRLVPSLLFSYQCRGCTNRVHVAPGLCTSSIGECSLQRCYSFCNANGCVAYVRVCFILCRCSSSNP